MRIIVTRRVFEVLLQRLATALLLAFATSAAAQCLQDPVPPETRGGTVDLGDRLCLEGTLVDDDRIARDVEVTVPTGDRTYQLVLEVSGGTQSEVCIEGGGSRTCRSAETRSVFPDVVLPAGVHVMRMVARGSAGSTYRFTLEDVGPAREGYEREPNDSVTTATVVGDDLTVRGRLVGREQDYFRVDITGEPQLWRVQVLGQGLHALRFHGASGRTEQERRAQRDDRSLRMSNLYLLPGAHYFSVDGTDTEYALRLIPLGPADPPDAEATAPDAPAATTDDARLGEPMAPRASAAAADVDVPLPTGPRPPGRMEREPNDHPRTAQLLRWDESAVGLLAESGDTDVYRFYLGEDGPVRITVVPPDDLALRVNVDGGPTVGLERGEPFVLERIFLAGDHELMLRTNDPGEGYYQIALERLDPFVLGDLPRPHAQPWQARPLPSDHEVRATLAGQSYVELPRLDAPSTLTVTVEDGIENTRVVSLHDADDSRVASADGRSGSGEFTIDVPAGGPYSVRIDGDGDVHLRFAFDEAGPPPQDRPEAPPVRMTLQGAREVAAYHSAAQRLALELVLEHTGDADVELTLETHASDYGWRVVPRDPVVRLGAGASTTVVLDAFVDPVARDDLDVAITVAVRDQAGGVATTTLTSSAVCGVPPLDPVQAWPLPDALLGGVNVAWSNLGSEPSNPARRELALYDGLTPPGTGWDGGVGEHTTVRLAGDGTPRLVGVLLHPLSNFAVPDRLADFRILTSLDGATFTTAFEGRMRSAPREQAFVFDESVAARYVRLEALSNLDGNPRGRTALGQFKVIAEPGDRVLGDRVDVSLRAHGGHVAAALPYLSSYELAEASTASRPASARLDPGQTHVWWVQAFHHNRAALLDGVAWIDHGAAGTVGNTVQIEEVTVSASLDGPLGPWTEIGTWRPREQREWHFDQPVWARFLRFESADLGEERPTVEFPDRVAIYEQPEGPEYRSVVGEWGHYADGGPYEWRHPPSRAESVEGGLNASRDDAAALEDGDVLERRVLVSEYDAWFAIDVPPDRNHLRLELTGDPSIDFVYAFTDADGDDVVADVTASAERVVIEAYVEPGRYYLHAWEPLRNVVFSWDDSGSMGPYIHSTYQTVFGFARDVDPTRELVQLEVFARDPYFLLDDWSGDPVEVLGALLAYPGDEGSSDAEVNLAYAVEQLADRDGTRAVLLVTDAESSPGARSVEPLWRAFIEAPAKVFTFETSSGGSDHTQDRMQTFAAVGGGFYDYTRTIGDLDVAFARASCLLRQPKAVRVALRLEAREPPGPGALAVRRPELSDEERQAAMPAVEVIFDASGSMGQLLSDGSASRLEVARRVLTELVDEVVETGTPFALRAYGHVSPMTCDTALAYPLAPLDRSTARAAIASVEPKLLSGTPLAASIEAVADDLAGATGPKTVILLTDGEESCDGDPDAAIRELVEQGIDVQLSIIGFDVVTDDAAAMRATFAEWAELGGGVFLEAADAAGLRAALESVLHADVDVRFEVLDEQGTVVAAGAVDGDAVPLPAGRYAVRVLGAQTRVLEGVVVRHETTEHLVLEDE